MLKIIRRLLLEKIEDIDSGNSNLSEKEAFQIVETLQKLSNTAKDFSKYSAARYLGISRATFDNYIKEGRLPKGKKEQGFKELRWYKKDLDDFRKHIKS